MAILSTVALSFYIPISTFVYICIIPCLVYNFVTKRFFLVLIAVLVFVTMLLMFIVIITGHIEDITENISLIAFLYNQIYPFGISVNLMSILSESIIYYCGLFIIMTIMIAWILHFDEFKVMIVFSYFIFVFTTLYLVLNIFLYLIPALRVLILENYFLQQIMTLFYGILPFIVFVLILLFLMTLYDHKQRQKNKNDVKQLNKIRFKRVGKVFKYFTLIFAISVFILMFLIGGML